MTREEFRVECERLMQNWKGAYEMPLIELIWNEVKGFSSFWWKRAVDDLIGTCKHPPRMPEIRPLIARERERQHEQDKRMHAHDAKEFMKSLSSEETQHFFKEMRRRMAGGMTDEQFQSFLKLYKRS